MAQRELTPLRIVSAPAPDRDPRASVEIYKPFFLAGMATVLTAGCTLGAIALLGIALKGAYASEVWLPYVLAHANSQLYGWVGFFVIGFALQQHAPSQSKLRLFHWLAYGSLGTMGLGIVLRFAAEPLVGSNPAIWLPVGVFSCALQYLAVLLFVLNTQLTRHRSGEGLSWQGRLVLTSLAWMLVVAAAEPFYFYFAHQQDPVGRVAFVAEMFPPYRDAQFLGFVAMMIFGVALTKMHSCFGARDPYRSLALWGAALWNVGLVARMAGWIVYFRSGMAHGSANLYFGGGVAIAVAAAMLVGSTRMFEPLRTRIPSHKFIRAAFCWLIIAGVMMVMEPIHLRATGLPFSHAYIGAIRHALTVGFISQMIIGVGTHVISQMNDIPASAQKSLMSVFILLNLGNAGRVALEAYTDYAHGAFLPMGATGFIELIGLGIWVWYAGSLMISLRHNLAVAAN